MIFGIYMKTKNANPRRRVIKQVITYQRSSKLFIFSFLYYLIESSLAGLKHLFAENKNDQSGN